MKKEPNNLLAKILFLVLLLACAACFLLARFITPSSLIIISALALVAAVSAENLKYGLAALAAFIVVILEFLHVLPPPYNYLFTHGLTMGPAILITLFAAAGYVIIAILIVLVAIKSKDKS